MSQNEAQEKNGGCGKSCLVWLIVFILIVACVVWGIQVVANKDNTDAPTLTTRKATTNDISIQSNDSNLISIEIVVTPKHDIDNLEITVSYYNKSNALLKTVTQYFGDVKEGGKYTKQVYITDFSLSQLFELDHCKYTVTGGTISYFK